MKHAADAVHVCRLQMKTWVKKKKKTDTERRVCAGHGKALRKPEVWGGRQASRGGRDRTRRRMECQFVCMEAHKLCQKKVGVCAYVCVCVRVCFHSRRCHAVWANGSPLRPSTACCRRHHPCCTQPASCQRLRHHSRWCQEPACPLISAEQMSLNCPPPHPLGNFTTTTRSRRHPNSQPSQRAKQATC